MLSDSPLQFSRALLLALGTRTFVHYENRVPQGGSVLVVSNHRSFMDAPLLMTAVGRSIRFACHHYMSQVPILREVVDQLGAFPLESMEQRQQSFFHQATQLLKARQAVGVFPEGAQPMVHLTQREEVTPFHRGFAHLALRSPIRDLAVLPVAIAPFEERVNSGIPLKLLSLFDPSEPLFNQEGWHPMVIYQRVNLFIGRPLWISAAHREQYYGRGARSVVADLTDYCQSEINELVRQGCY